MNEYLFIKFFLILKVFIVLYLVFYGLVEILIGYSNCLYMFNIEKFNRYNKFLENVVRNIYMGFDNV